MDYLGNANQNDNKTLPHSRENAIFQKPETSVGKESSCTVW